MALTQIEDGVITDSILTASKLITTGTASSTTVLKGDFSWGAGASTSGKWNTADSAPGTPVAGDIWYTGGTIYIAIATADAVGQWASAPSMTQIRDYTKGCGTQTAAIVCGKEYSNVTDVYNGTSWSAGGSMLFIGAYQSQGGTQSAAWMAGGRAEGSGTNRTDAALYDGTSWSATGSLQTGMWLGQGFGLQSAGVCCGGNDGSFSDTTEEFDGTSWSAVNNMLSTRGEGVATGILSAGLTMGGEAAPGGLTSSEEYDGTSWSAGGTVPYNGTKGQGGTGLQTASLMWGGATNLTTNVQYDGTTWSFVSPLIIGRQSLSAGAGSTTAGLVAGGRSNNIKIAESEEWSLGGAFNAKNVGYG